jgi:predicted aspartyl protease
VPLTSRYRSLFESDLPGPYVTARIGRGDGGEHRELPALLDTGADITLIPKHAIDALSLQMVSDDLELHDATGRVTPNATMYFAVVQFGLRAHLVGISATEDAIAFIGRDILNEYIATFRGPAQVFTVE